MKFWWLLGLVLFLIVAMTFRESFVSYADALKDVGQTAGYTSLTPKCPEGSSLNAEKTMCKFTDTKKPDVVPTCSSDTLEFVGGTCRPKPGGAGSSGGATTGTTTGGTSSSTATGTTSGTSGVTVQCPAGFVEDKRLWDGKLRCKKEVGQPKCPNGYTMSPFVKMAEGQYNGGTCTKGTDLTAPQCEGESMLNVMNDKQVCVEYAFASSTGASTGATTGTNATGGTTTQTTSGTGSGVTPSTVKKSGLLGPAFTSYGTPITPGNSDSYKTTKYPELLGGGDPAARNRESGAGGRMNIDLQGSLPTMDGLGATEASKYFPFSRQPGDMELIPDPYRVSQQFSSASYSSKTEPTPFLTDFSAFLR